MAFTPPTSTPDTHRRHILPTIWLLILPAFIAEALSGATPPLTFFLQPNILIAFSLYYGSGAILAREMSLRWHRGWPSVLLFGAAFAVIQEGLGTKVFFDPTRTEVSPLVNYGTADGVHWVFVIQLIIYHAVYSISVPILLVELMFPSRRHERWVGGLGLILALVCLIVVTWLLFLIYPFQPPAGPYVSAAVLAIIFCVLARFAPVTRGERPFQTRGWSARMYWLSGLIAGGLLFLVSFGAPSANVPPLVTAVALLAIAIGCGWLVALKSVWGRTWSDRDQLALAAGLLSPLIALAFFQETRGRSGSILVALAAAVLLIWLARRNSTRSQPLT